MVAMGEYSTGCICQVPKHNVAGLDVASTGGGILAVQAQTVRLEEERSAAAAAAMAAANASAMNAGTIPMFVPPPPPN